MFTLSMHTDKLSIYVAVVRGALFNFVDDLSEQTTSNWKTMRNWHN
jgi:hypothetical protein